MYMNINIFIPIATAAIGGILATVPSYISYKSKKIELEHAYNISIEEKIYTTALDHVDSLYKPIYLLIIKLEQSIRKGSFDSQSIERYIELCESIISNSDMIFLADYIESDLLSLYSFLTKSIFSSNYIIGIKMENFLFGIQSIRHFEEEFKTEKDAMRAIRKYNFQNIMSQSLLAFPYFNLFNAFKVKYSYYYKAAPINNEKFSHQISDYVTSIKSNIKSILLKKTSN